MDFYNILFGCNLESIIKKKYAPDGGIASGSAGKVLSGLLRQGIKWQDGGVVAL